MTGTKATEVYNYMLPLGETVGAGSSILQFPQLNPSFINLHLPVLPIPVKDAIVYPVSGSSLVADKIYDGDYLIATKNFTKEDIRTHKICIVLLHNTEYLAKHVHFEPNGKISLGSCGDGDRHNCNEVEPDEVEIIGIVVGSYRPAP